MKVVLVSTWFFEYLIELSNALSRCGCKVVLVLSSNIDDLLGKNWENLLHPNVKIKKYKISPLLSRLNLFLALYNYILIIYFILKEKPDVIHIQECYNPIIWMILPILKIKFPIVLTLHDVKPHISEESKYRELIVKLFIRYVNVITVHGKYLKDLAAVFLKLKRENIYIVPHGEFSIYLKFAKRRNYKNTKCHDSNNIILFFGRILRYKGIEYLIKAKPLVSKIIPNIKIIIAGTGKHLEFYRPSLEKSKFVIYDRYIPNTEIPRLFQQSSIVVLPYIDASQSGVVPIAYIFKKPVIVTNVGALPEVVDHRKTGLVIPPKNEKSLADAIVELLANPKLRKKFGKNAYNKARYNLSWLTIAKKYIKIYKTLKYMEDNNENIASL